MAEFQQERAASAAVGTPGISRTAGAAAQALSQGTQQIIQGEEAVADAQRSAIFGGVAAIGNALAVGFRERRQAIAAQKSLNNQMQVARDVALFERHLDDKRESIKQTMLNDPEKAEQAFDDAVKKYLRDTGGDAKYDSDLKAKAKFVEAVESATTRELDKMRSWSANRRTAISQGQSENLIDEEALTLANKSGSIPELFTAFRESRERVSRMLNRAETPLGSEKIKELSLKAESKLSESLFENLAATRPDSLEDRLTHVQIARTYLDKADANGVMLDPGTKRKFQNTFDSLESQYTKDLSEHLLLEEYKADFKITERRQFIDQHWNQPAIQQAAINEAEQRTKELAKQTELVSNHPTLPESIKTQYVKLYKAQAAHLDSLTTKATANLKAVAAEARADARQALTDRRRAESEARREKREQMSAERAQATQTIYNLREELYSLALDPEKNNDAIKETATQLLKYTQGQSDNPALAQLMGSTRLKALEVLEKANAYGRETIWLGSLFGMKGPLKKLDEEKARQVQSEAVQSIRSAARDMKTLNRQADASKYIPGWSDKHEEEFQKQLPILLDSIKQGKIPAAELETRTARLRNYIMSQGGK